MKHILWEGDTELEHYQVIDTVYDGRPARVLYSGDQQAAQSGIANDEGTDLLFDYNQRLFELITNLAPSSILLIGGGAFTLPSALLASLPSVLIDVVEPDSGLIEIAHAYFALPKTERLRIITTDGRTFLREQASRYDVIIVDAFMHTSAPKDLKTIEAFRAYHKHLKGQGLLAMNIISAYYGRGSVILEQLYAAADQTFDAVDIFLAGSGYSLWLPQNFILTAQKGQTQALNTHMRYEPVDSPKVSHGMALTDE